MRIQRWALIMFAAAVIAFAGPLTAQARVELGPVIAYYRPLAHFESSSVYPGQLPRTPQALSGTAWGGQARVWVGRHFGVGAEASVASSKVSGGVTPSGYVEPPTPASVLIVSTRLLYDVSSTPRIYRAWLGAGPGLVRHGGDAYTPFGSPVEVAAALGAGASVRLIAGLRASAGVRMLLYPFNVSVPYGSGFEPGSLEHGFQTDMLLQVGAVWGVP